VSRAEERSNSSHAWGRAVADVTVLFDYFDFEPVREDFEELTRLEWILERARETTSSWRGYVETIADRLRPVLRVAVALIVVVTGGAALLGVSGARLLFATTCLLVTGTLVTKRALARRRAREEARRRAAERAAYTLIEGPRRVPIDVLRVRDGAASSLRPQTLEALRG